MCDVPPPRVGNNLYERGNKYEICIEIGIGICTGGRGEGRTEMEVEES